MTPRRSSAASNKAGLGQTTGGRTATGKTGSSKSTTSFVEIRWRPFTDHAEKSRLRRGKALTKQGAVQRMSCQDGWVTASVRTGGLGDTFKVTVPAVGWWAPQTSAVALWLARRPDWLAALLAGKWDSELIAFLDENEVHLFPTPERAERMVTQSSCSCSDLQQPCVHVIAVIEQMLVEVEADPVSVFSYVGIAPDKLLDQVYEQTARMVQQRQAEETRSYEDAVAVNAHAKGEVEVDSKQMNARSENDSGSGPDETNQANQPSGWARLWSEEEAAFAQSISTGDIHHVIAPSFRKKEV